jgi:hypothetical protein
MNNEPAAWINKYGDEGWLNWDEAKGEGWTATPLYLHPERTLTDEGLIESLAELEHEQWMAWADSIMKSEVISASRHERWSSLMIPYAELSEEMKEHDRTWARKALAILKREQEK